MTHSKLGSYIGKILLILFVCSWVISAPVCASSTKIEDGRTSDRKANVDKVGSKSGLLTSILEKGLQVRIAFGTTGDADGNPEYVGWAAPDVKDSETEWRIIKITWDSDGPTGIYFANQVATYTLEWDEKGNYDYSP